MELPAVERLPDLEAIKRAAERIRPYIHQTPVLSNRTINALADGKLFFKCENFQKGGAFKIRGATNAVFSLSEEEAGRGVVTHSSGNHAQALALAARNRGIKATIVMPRNASAVKKAAVKDYGAEIIFCPPSLLDREAAVRKLARTTGAVFIHPYNDERIIAGQATVGLELLKEMANLDLILVPVGGGGLMSGTALVTSFISDDTQVVGVEPEKANDAYRSFIKGKIVPVKHPRTIADGLRTSLGDLTYAAMANYVRGIVTVSEKAIVGAMRLLWERMKIVVEPSGAVPLAAVLEKQVDVKDKRVGVILSGGNVDLEKLPWLK